MISKNKNLCSLFFSSSFFLNPVQRGPSACCRQPEKLVPVVLSLCASADDTADREEQREASVVL